MRKADQQLHILEEALRFAKRAEAGAAAELEFDARRSSVEPTTMNMENARLRLVAAKQTVEEIETLIAFRQAKLSGRKIH